MATYPATRRPFLDGETRNQGAALAGLIREIALSQNTAYARDLNVTPCDPGVFASQWWAYGMTTPWTPNLRLYDHIGTVNFAEIFLVDPRGPFRQVRLWTRWKLEDSAQTATAWFTNGTTNAVTTLSVTYAALGSALEGWLSVDVDAAALQTIYVTAGSTTAVGVDFQGLSGYWLQPSIAGVTAAALDSMDPAALSRDDGPYSTLLLRHLARTANAHWYGRPLQVVAKWFSGYGSGTTADWSSWPRCVGRYKIWIGAKVSGIQINMRTLASAAASVTVAIPGLSATTSIAIDAGDYAAAGTLTFTAPAQGAVHEVTVTVDGNPDYVAVNAITITENATTLPFAAPTDFIANEDGAIVGSSSITNAIVARMLDNERWLWAYRRMRTLVADSRYTPAGDTSQLVAAHGLYLSRPGVSTADQAAPLLIRQGVHLVNDAGLTDGPLTTYEIDHLATEYAWAPHVSRPDGAGNPSIGWAAHASAHWQHRQEHKYTAGGLIRMGTYGYGGLTHHAWTIVEELPIGTPFLIGAP